MIVLLLVATPLFTYGTAMIEAGAQERGESALHALLSTSISEQMRDRILYNLGVAALDQSSWNEALSYFQQIERGQELKPFVQQRIEMALKERPKETWSPFDPLPNPLSLKEATQQVGLVLRNITSLSFEGGETSAEYSILKERIESILQKRGEWWGSVVKKQEEMAPKGCFQQHWEGVVQLLGEATGDLQKAAVGFSQGAKPYAVLYPLLQEALNHLQIAEKGVETEQLDGGKTPGQTERFQTLSEMFRKDAAPPPAIPKGALW